MMSILDTAGQEAYKMMRDSWMRAGDAFLLCFDVGNRGSFEELDELAENIIRVRGLVAPRMTPDVRYFRFTSVCLTARTPLTNRHSYRSRMSIHAEMCLLSWLPTSVTSILALAWSSGRRLRRKLRYLALLTSKPQQRRVSASKNVLSRRSASIGVWPGSLRQSRVSGLWVALPNRASSCDGCSL